MKINEKKQTKNFDNNLNLNFEVVVVLGIGDKIRFGDKMLVGKFFLSPAVIRKSRCGRDSFKVPIDRKFKQFDDNTDRLRNSRWRDLFT